MPIRASRLQNAYGVGDGRGRESKRSMSSGPGADTPNAVDRDDRPSGPALPAERARRLDGDPRGRPRRQHLARGTRRSCARKSSKDGMLTTRAPISLGGQDVAGGDGAREHLGAGPDQDAVVAVGHARRRRAPRRRVRRASGGPGGSARARSGRRCARWRRARPRRPRSRRPGRMVTRSGIARSAGEVLDRLVRRSVLAEGDRVVGEDEDRRAAPSAPRGGSCSSCSPRT